MFTNLLQMSFSKIFIDFMALIEVFVISNAVAEEDLRKKAKQIYQPCIVTEGPVKALWISNFVMEVQSETYGILLGYLFAQFVFDKDYLMYHKSLLLNQDLVNALMSMLDSIDFAVTIDTTCIEVFEQVDIIEVFGSFQDNQGLKHCFLQAFALIG